MASTWSCSALQIRSSPETGIQAHPLDVEGATSEPRLTSPYGCMAKFCSPDRQSSSINDHTWPCKCLTRLYFRTGIRIALPVFREEQP